MNALRAFIRAARRRRGGRPEETPPAFWGRVGDYEAVSRHGMLFLLSPASIHPSRRVTNVV